MTDTPKADAKVDKKCLVFSASENTLFVYCRGKIDEYRRDDAARCKRDIESKLETGQYFLGADSVPVYQSIMINVNTAKV